MPILVCFNVLCSCTTFLVESDVTTNLCFPFFQGRKMSKTLGNVIDPLDTIKEYGTDALRFTLSLGTAGQVCVSFSSYFIGINNRRNQFPNIITMLRFVELHSYRNHNLPKFSFWWSYQFYPFLQDLNLSIERLNSNKAFTNKLWNAGKFVLQNLPRQNDLSAWEAMQDFKVFQPLNFLAIKSCSLTMAMYFDFELKSYMPSYNMKI